MNKGESKCKVFTVEELRPLGFLVNSYAGIIQIRSEGLFSAHE